MERPFCGFTLWNQPEIDLKQVSSLDIIEPENIINSEFSFTDSEQHCTFNISGETFELTEGKHTFDYSLGCSPFKKEEH